MKTFLKALVISSSIAVLANFAAHAARVGQSTADDESFTASASTIGNHAPSQCTAVSRAKKKNVITAEDGEMKSPVSKENQAGTTR